ncbi:xanthine dehydrogenase family protein molybdopterin-binding subunit (plasmid) [Skermanella sp. TT6]|uniref:Xanthine dehydrogenase family protein molybdopterin-binding subunit n=1 Tax=Skermanella cutis TaxID=2775420 RepID=A0ABX7BEL6_9PROT|nr:xanthine dehydrogenase family protein molybdopterin-binding subunit [Skermanella sp. TT6]QQP92860.1 xanthine dehydrogenase family protein molybdopterin-binding subunit [Skermanella sp. TT6]
MTRYQMNSKHAGMALDRGVQGVLGRPVPRIDGIAKVTGAATYALEHPVGNLAYGVAVTAPVGKGRVTSIDTAAARALPGVIDVIAGDGSLPRDTPVFGRPDAPLYDGTIGSYGEVVGVAIAESFEAARAGAMAVTVRCEAIPGRFDIRDGQDDALATPEGALLPDTVVGDIETAMREAPVTLDVTYTTPTQVHAAMEPYGSIASWDGDRLTLRAPVQLVTGGIAIIARSLGIRPEDIRILSPFIGGGFGGKTATADMLLAAVAARRLGRPVKVALSRRQTFHATYGRSETIQRIRLGAGPDGRLTAIGQDSLVGQKAGASAFFEPVALGAVALYAGANRSFTTRTAQVDLTARGPVRAPGEAVGMLGLECAMDEMAEKLGLDPIEFRKLNEPSVDPSTGKPFSTRRLVDCYDEGARRFGWAERERRREGDWLIGHGMATASRVNFLAKATARVRLGPDGRAAVETDMTDLGTGTYTILAQVAGEALGIPVEGIDVRLGDSEYPSGSGSGGSFGAASSASSVALACEDIVAELARRMGAASADMTLKDGHAIAGNRRVALSELVGASPIEGLGTIEPGSNSASWSQSTHGAQFAEVAVHAVTGEVRVRRMLAVFDCGRVLNHRTARSQAIGGMIWGIGYALHEHAVVDPRTGAYVNRDLAEYHVPANADVPQIEVFFIEEIDRQANPVGAKGLGEAGISGAGAAVANAVHDACGVRVRDYPITPDKLLAGLPPVR